MIRELISSLRDLTTRPQPAKWLAAIALGALVVAGVLYHRSRGADAAALPLPDAGMRPIAQLVSAGDMPGAAARLDAAYHFNQRPGLSALRAFSLLVLERGLREPDVFERYFAASALAKGGRRDGVSLLESGFKTSPDLSVKMAAADGLGDIGDAYAVEILRKLYSAASEFDRRIVVNSLADASDPTAIVVLSDAAGRSDQKLRLAALQGLGKLGNRDAAPLLRKIMIAPGVPIEQAMAASALLRLGEAADLSLIRQVLVNPKNGQARSVAALALGYARDPSVVPTLRHELADDDLDVRIAAAAALTHYRERDGVDYLKHALVDEDDSVSREHAGQVLDQVAFDGGYDVLTAAAGSLDQNLQMSGVRALGLGGGAKEVALLSEMLPHTSDPLMRAQIAWSLGRIAQSDGIAILIALVQEKDPAVRYTAADALDRTAQRLLAQIKG
jgi:HEAT repeat protein